MEGQIRKFRKGIHPKTGVALPPSVEMDLVIPPIRRIAEEDEHKPPDVFYGYVPAILPRAVISNSGGGPSTVERREAMLERTKAKGRTMNTDAATREPCATLGLSRDNIGEATTCPTGNAIGSTAAICPTMNVTTDLVDGMVGRHGTKGENDGPVLDVGSNERPREFCVTWCYFARRSDQGSLTAICRR